MQFPLCYQKTEDDKRMEKWKVPELKAKTEKLKLEVEGTGANGRKVRNDYLQALLKYERNHPKWGPKQTPKKKTPKRSGEIWLVETISFVSSDAWDYTSDVEVFPNKKETILRVKQHVDEALEQLKEDHADEDAYKDDEKRIMELYEKFAAPTFSDDRITIYAWDIGSNDYVNDITIYRRRL